MLPGSLIAPERVRPLRRREYDRLVELGAFEGERLELLYGCLVTRSRPSPLDARAITELTRSFVLALGGRALVNPQLPFAAANESEPEPDLAVVPSGNYLDEHPSRAHLIIEVAGDSLRDDRIVKGRLYAESGVPEYWLVDVEARRVEVYRHPDAGAYTEQSVHGRDASLSPLAFPDVILRVEDFLPPPSPPK
jgi:Uma2 family endonuclease